MWLIIILILSMGLHPAEKYARDVESGKIKTGELIKLSVNRYHKDLKEAKKKGWYFDREAAESAIEFCSMLKHYKGKGAGENFNLLPYQQFQWWNLYGWKKKSGERRFRRNYEEVSRKNGKSTGSAARALLRILVDEPTGAQVYCAATKENQAHIIPNDAAGILSGTGLSDLVDTKKVKEHVTRVITIEDPVSYIRSIGRDSKTEDGRHASEIKIDEYHAWDSDYLLDVLEQSMKGRANPLTDITTTAGLPYVSGKDGVCFAFRKMCIDVLRGIKEDDSLFIMIHSLDEGDDWEDSKNWHKANPSLDQPGCVTLEDLKIDFIAAKNQGQSKIVEFKTKSLNVWTDAPKVWIEDKIWMKSKAGSLYAPAPYGQAKTNVRWFAGYDGGRTYDFSSWVLMSEPDEEGYHDVIPFYWIPDETLEAREKEDRTTYRDWREKKHLFTTPGNSISTPDIRAHIIEMHGFFDIETTFYDPALFSGEMMSSLSEELGGKFTPYSQGIMSMSPPTKEIEGLILKGKLRHGGHPVLRWNIRNSVLKIDNNENIKIMKDNPKQRADGAVAMVMAYAAYDAWKKEQNNTTDWGIA
jgi:phage terminase large subunit-like protein